MKGTDVTDQLIEDTYNEIFLQTLDTRQSRAVYQYEHHCTCYLISCKISFIVRLLLWRRDLERQSRRKQAPLRNVLDNTDGDRLAFSGIDKESFEAWWLTDVEEDEFDTLLEKKRVKARLGHVMDRADSMKAQMDRMEEMVQKLR